MMNVLLTGHSDGITRVCVVLFLWTGYSPETNLCVVNDRCGANHL